MAQTLEGVGVKLDPSAITRIERGTRDVKLAEAVAIATVLNFNLETISYGPADHFVMDENGLVASAAQARRALLDAIREVDRIANRTEPETEERIIAARGLSGITDLYTLRLRESPAFKRFGRLMPQGGEDNYAVYTNDDDRSIKQAVVNAVTNEILVSEDDLESHLHYAKTPSD